MQTNIWLKLVIGDAKVTLTELSQALGSWKAPDTWYKKSRS